MMKYLPNWAGTALMCLLFFSGPSLFAQTADVEFCVDLVNVQPTDLTGVIAQFVVQSDDGGQAFNNLTIGTTPGSTVWCGTFPLNVGEEVRYAFRFAGPGVGGIEILSTALTPCTTSDGVGGVKRTYTPSADAGQSVGFVWESCDPVGTVTPMVSITFEVGTSHIAVAPSGLFIAGGAAFGGPGNPAYQLLDPDGDGVYSLTITRPEGFTSDYTITNGACGDYSCKEDISGLACAVGQYSDRALPPVAQDTVLSTCFGLCTDDTNCPVTPMVDITFEVGTSHIAVAPSGIFIAGGATFGAPGNPANQLLDADGDGVYTLTITRPVGFEDAYTFTNGACGDYSCKEDIVGLDCAFGQYSDRMFTAVAQDTVLSTCFGLCTDDTDCPVLPMVAITFEVGTSNLLSVSPDGIYLAGGGNFGNPGDNQMTDPDGDGVYTITVMRPQGFSSFYTFTNGACGDYSCKEDIVGLDCAAGQYNDRFFPAVAQDTVLSTCFAVCIDDTNCPPPPVQVEVEFCVDYSCVSGATGFAAQQIIFGAGAFNGLQDQGNDVWCGTFTLIEGDEVRYSFFYAGAAGAGGPENLAGLPCATDGVGGFKRTYLVPSVAPTEPITFAWETCGSSAGPTAVCQDVTVELDEMGNGSIQASATAQPITSVSGTLDATDLEFERPDGAGTACAINTGDPNHSFDVLEFTIDAEDMYTFTMDPTSNTGDFYFLLYEGGFDQDNPCDNHIAGDDDSAGSLDPEIMIELVLVPGNYSLVITEFSSFTDPIGDYTFNISSANGGSAFPAGENNDPAVNNGSVADCVEGGLTFSLDNMDFDCDDLGDGNTVTLTVTDAGGNIGTCTATVTVEDNIAPVVVANGPTVTLNDDNIEVTLTNEDILTATDNCDDMPTIEFDRPLTFTSDDIGTVTFTATVTDASGNETIVLVTVVVGFDQPNLACIGTINLTLNDECQGLVIPSMVLTGNTGLIDAFPFSITVNDSDPSNGPIIDGCGEFTYSISVPEDLEPTFGFTGAYRPSSWTEIIFAVDGLGNQIPMTSEQNVDVDFTSAAMVISTEAGVFNTGSEFGAQLGITFSETGTANFDYDFNGIDANFDQAFSITTFEGNIVDIQFNALTATAGTAAAAIEPGYSLIIQLRDDGFQPFAGQFASILTIDNFSFIPPVNPLDLDFETCWGIVRAEDKTPPALVSTPDDVDLLCVDLDVNNVSTLPVSVSRCYRVNASTGATIPGSMASALRARLLALTVSPVVPTFTDGCSDELEVCVSDAVVFGDDPSCDDVVITRTFVATEIAVCTSAAGEENASVSATYTLTFDRPTLDDLDGDNIEDVVNYESCGADASVRPAPRVGDFPFLVVGDRTFNLQDGEAVCNIGVTYADGRVSLLARTRTSSYVLTP